MRKPGEAFLLRRKLLDVAGYRGKPKPKSMLLKGGQQITAFLDLPISEAQRWAKAAMPWLFAKAGYRQRRSARVSSWR
jgi:hypothetical protein